MTEEKTPRKFYWHAGISSGGTLSLNMDFQGSFSKKEIEGALAGAIANCKERMRDNGYIPSNARLMSSRDIAQEYGSTRQYWEKLLNEGKIRYKETSAGRITTDLWVDGYLGNREEVNQYVKDVQEVLARIAITERKHAPIACPSCEQVRFRFAVNAGGNTNGICDECGFHIHTTE